MTRRTMQRERETAFPHLAAFGVPLVGVPLLWVLLTLGSPAAPDSEVTVGPADEQVVKLLEPGAAVRIEPAGLVPEGLGGARI